MMQKTIHKAETLLDRTAVSALFLFLVFAVLTFIAYGLSALAFRYTLDYGEAPLMDQAVRIASGENIYRPDISAPPYTIANYPPLYVAAVAPFTRLFGPSFAIGRAISLASSLLVALFLALISYTLSQDRLAAAVPGLLYLSWPFVIHWSSLMRIDLLALALSTGGVFLLVRWPRRKSLVTLAAVMLAGAIYTRQSYALAAPLAGFVWLWQQETKTGGSAGNLPRYLARKQNAMWLALVTGGLSLLLLLALNLATRGGFYFNIVTANVNDFSLERLGGHLERLRDTAPVLTAAALIFLVLAPGRIKGWQLLLPYLLGSFVASLTIGKIGSNVNYFLEVIAAGSLVAGALLAWARQRPWLRALLMLALAWQAAWLTFITYDEFVAAVLGRYGQAEEIAKMEGLIADAAGPILADEYMGLVTLQGQPLYLQPFEVTQLAHAGVWDQQSFVESIDQGEFDWILIYHHPDFPLHEERWTPEMLRSVEKSYQLNSILADTYVYRPKGDEQEGQSTPQSCPGAPWSLPSSSRIGVKTRLDGLDFLALGNENTIPVFAVASGLLTRLPDWSDRVAILHDDPLRPGHQVWSLYTGMADSTAEEDYIVEDFSPGAQTMPVSAGQLLGYQGVWSGQPLHRAWLHVHFSVVDATAGEAFPDTEVTPLPVAPYLGIYPDLESLRALRCLTDSP